MLVSIDKRLAYLAMPKTGTTAVQKVLAPLCDIHFRRRVKHMNMKAFQRFMLPYLQRIGAGEVETLCVIREPMDWLGSWYRYRRRDGIRDGAKSTRRVSFAEFVEAYLQDPQPAFARLGGISEFVTGRGNAPAVTHIYRYENLPAVATFLSQRFGKHIELPRINASPRGDLDLPPALRARLETERAADFALYADVAR